MLVKDRKRFNQDVYSISVLNLDNIDDEHGSHVTTNIRDSLSHLAKQKEYGSLFGYF